MKSYKDLEIYQISFELALKIRKKSLLLEHPDRFEVGNQIRRSSQGIKDAIVEGYGRRRYKADFIKFLTYSYASLLEATSQANFLDRIFPE
ncbi:MAG: four helix bundle protein, partial [Bacteroidales bacterium]